MNTIRIGYKLKFKKLGVYQNIAENATEQEAQDFYNNIPDYFDKLVANNEGLTGAIFCIGGKSYAYGSCIGIKGYRNVIPYKAPIEKKKTDITQYSTEELIMELINRGYAVSKSTL